MALSSDADSDRSDVNPPLSVIAVSVPPHDNTALTVIDTSATSNPTSHSETDSTDRVVVQEPVVNTQDA